MLVMTVVLYSTSTTDCEAQLREILEYVSGRDWQRNWLGSGRRNRARGGCVIMFY